MQRKQTNLSQEITKMVELETTAVTGKGIALEMNQQEERRQKLLILK
jgi:hypothetical protein